MQLNRHINIASALDLVSGASGGTVVLDSANAPYGNLGQSNNPLAVVVINMEGALVGTNPSVTFYLQVSADGINFVNLPNNSGAITDIRVVRFVNDYVLEPFIQLIAVITGASTPEFPNVDIDLFMTSPDS